METREYFEKIMQDYNQNRNGRSLRKYCKDEAVDYNWLMEFKKTYGVSETITLDCYNRDCCYGGGYLYKDAGPYEWVYLLSHASYVCMDSFHATIFALKFHKEFVHAMKGQDAETGSQNTRMYDVFYRYGLMYKNYTGLGTDWQHNIDFNQVDNLLEDDLLYSSEYLKCTIS